jgi:hypothetical protein
MLSLCENLGQRAKQYLMQWTQPVTATLITGALSDMTRSCADLIAAQAIRWLCHTHPRI